ncbi:MAG: M48 family metallopeptidase, partial [Planctomycetales bacterium]
AIMATLLFVDSDSQQPLARPELALAAIGAAAALQCVFAWLITFRCRRRLQQRGDVLEYSSLIQFERLRLAHSVFWLIASAAIYGVCGWGRIVRFNWGLEHIPVLEDVLLLTPLLAPWLASLTIFYDVERWVRDRLPDGPPKTWSRREYLGFQLRHNLGIILVPLIALLAAEDVVALAAPGLLDSNWAWAILLPPIGMLLLFFPILLRFLWNAKPLPAGPLRSRLETTARRLGVRVRDVLIWNTGSVVGNAAVVGLLPNLRYVFLSDALILALDDEEVEAVFGHEAGHLALHHVFLRLLTVIAPLGIWSLFALAFPAAVAQASGRFSQWGLDETAQVSLGVVLGLAVYVPTVFTALSRRLEVQADLIGCRAVAA